MADYNIYIHSMSEGGTVGNGSPTFNPTAPWGSQEAGASSGGGEQEETKETPSFLASGKVMKKIGKTGKFGPAVVIAAAVVKISYSVAKMQVEHQAIENGDFRISNAFANFEAGKNALFHPVSTTIQSWKQQQTDVIQSERLSLQRDLLGDSEINRYSNRGY